MSRAREVSKIVTLAVTDAELSSALENVTVDLSGYATTEQLSASVSSIDVTSQLDERIFISSASPTTGNIDGRIWINTVTASAPVIQIYNNESFRVPKLVIDKASGGNIYYYGQYTVHAFTGGGNFIANQELICDILLVGGGGAGGTSYGDQDTGKGGGGAGGLVFGTNKIISAGTYPITIGHGGEGRSNGNNTAPPAANQGGNTTGFGVTAIGGGGGGGSDNNNSGPTSGGSGGGGGSRNSTTSFNNGAPSTQTTFSGWSSFGNAGANSTSSSGFGGAGGGGAGGAGQTYSGSSNNSVGGNGGIGKDYSSYFGTLYGESGWFAGGGGGGSYSTSSVLAQSSGGFGGGGKGVSARESNGSPSPQFASEGRNGLANSGGGGGGSSEDGQDSNGLTPGGGSASGSGGSGIVLIRYLT